MYPTRAAKKDWKVLRKTGNLKSSGAVEEPYGVVVRRSWRRAHVRKEPYIPPTANTNCNAPASFTSGRGSGFTKSPFRIACPLLLSFSLSKFLGLRLGVPPPSFLLKYSDDGSLRNGVACFVRAITCAGLTRCALESSERKESQVRPLN